MLQVASYADQLARAGLPLSHHTVPAPWRRAARRRCRCTTCYRSSRATGPAARHHRRGTGAGVALGWGDDSHTICGYCPECVDAIASHTTSSAWRGFAGTSGASCVRPDPDASRARRRHGGPGRYPGRVDLRDPVAPRRRAGRPARVRHGPPSRGQSGQAGEPPVTLPAPSAGDLFFDFEGDPLYNEDDPAAPGSSTSGVASRTTAGGVRAALGARLRQERAAFVEFMDLVAECREQPGHAHLPLRPVRDDGAQAPRGATGPRRRSSTTCSAPRSSSTCTPRCAESVGSRSRRTPSRSSSRSTWATSSARATCRRATSRSPIPPRGRPRASDDESAATRLKELQEYNAYDCSSTQRLRDWLLDDAECVGRPPVPRTTAPSRPSPRSRWTGSA